MGRSNATIIITVQQQRNQSMDKNYKSTSKIVQIQYLSFSVSLFSVKYQLRTRFDFAYCRKDRHFCVIIQAGATSNSESINFL